MEARTGKLEKRDKTSRSIVYSIFGGFVGFLVGGPPGAVIGGGIHV